MGYEGVRYIYFSSFFSFFSSFLLLMSLNFISNQLPNDAEATGPKTIV